MLTRLTVISASVLALAIPAAPQQPCTRTIPDAPAVFGLKLGMAFNEVGAVIGPTVKIKPKKSGEGSLFLDFNEQEPPPTLKDARAVYIRYFDNKVYQIEVFFDRDELTKLEDLIGRLSAQFALPPDAWTIKNGRAAIDCGSYTLTADNVLNRHIELTDKAAKLEFDKRKVEKEKNSKKRKKS